MSEARTTKLFRLDGHLILEIPEGWEFSGDEVEILKDGDRLIIRPVQETEPAREPDGRPSI